MAQGIHAGPAKACRGLSQASRKILPTRWRKRAYDWRKPAVAFLRVGAGFDVVEARSFAEAYKLTTTTDTAVHHHAPPLLTLVSRRQMKSKHTTRLHYDVPSATSRSVIPPPFAAPIHIHS